MEELETSIGEPAHAGSSRRFRNPTCKFKAFSSLDSARRPPQAPRLTRTRFYRRPQTHHYGHDALGNENTFLQLLVAQIQNQDPTQPMDSSTFLTQLAEFSSARTIDRHPAGCRSNWIRRRTSTLPSHETRPAEVNFQDRRTNMSSYSIALSGLTRQHHRLGRGRQQSRQHEHARLQGQQRPVRGRDERGQRDAASRHRRRQHNHQPPISRKVDLKPPTDRWTRRFRATASSSCRTPRAPRLIHETAASASIPPDNW